MASARRLVVVGNGMAAGRTLEELLDRAPGLYEVTIFGAEPRVNYNRIMLSPVLAGEAVYDDIVIHDDAWYARHGINLHRGQTVVAIDRETRRVVTRDGMSIGYDRLLIATGSQPFMPPLPGAELPGVVAYRDLDDVHAMLAAARRGGRAIVIGGGLLGLEAAAGLRGHGMDVTVLHLKPTLLDRQLDAEAGGMLQRTIEARGIVVHCNANTAAVLGGRRVEGLRLADGLELPADLVVMAIGIRPNVDLARRAGLAVGRGIIVDDGLATSDAAIMAVGECVEHRGQTYGLVAPLYEMGKVAAARLGGDDAAVYEGSVTATKLKVTGINLFSAGDFAAGPGREEIIARDPLNGGYRRLIMRDSRLLGAVLYGDTGDGPWLFDLVQRGTDVSAIRDTLLFGEAFAAMPTATAARPPAVNESTSPHDLRKVA